MENKTRMIYDLVKQVKETGVGADGTVVCSMDELVALVDYAWAKGYNDAHYDCDDEDEYEEDDYEDDYEEEEIEEDEEPTLEDLFKEFMALYMAKGR